MKLESIEEVLDVAIKKEEAATRTYREMADNAERDDLRDLLLSIALEEEAHRKALERVREGDLSVFARPWPDRQELVAPSTSVNLAPDITPARALLAAIERERRAFQLYTELSQQADDPGIRTLLDSIAREEAGHWDALERAYDELVGGDKN